MTTLNGAGRAREPEGADRGGHRRRLQRPGPLGRRGDDAGGGQAGPVSEATAYRYFPDLISLLREALDGAWPDPAEALAPVAGSADPAVRVAFACEYLLRGVHAYQGAVRAMIAHTITAPAAARTRPGIRFGLIDYALAPFGQQGSPAGLPHLPAEALADLKRELAVAVSAEAFFVLTDLCGLAPDDAIHTAAAARPP